MPYRKCDMHFGFQYFLPKFVIGFHVVSGEEAVTRVVVASQSPHFVRKGNQYKIFGLKNWIPLTQTHPCAQLSGIRHCLHNRWGKSYF